jgi:hypothetical protein
LLALVLASAHARSDALELANCLLRVGGVHGLVRERFGALVRVLVWEPPRRHRSLPPSSWGAARSSVVRGGAAAASYAREICAPSVTAVRCTAGRAFRHRDAGHASTGHPRPRCRHRVAGHDGRAPPRSLPGGGVGVRRPRLSCFTTILRAIRPQPGRSFG